MMKQILYFFFLLLFCSCTSHRQLTLPTRPATALSGSAFYQQAAGYTWQQRDSLAVREILSGNMPDFFQKFVAIPITTSRADGTTIQAVFYASPDYMSIGNEKDWARIPLTPMAGQQLADSLGCFLPTRKMVNTIYEHATVKLEPLPLYALRDSTPTMFHHHLMIEGQRQGRKGLIAGIKKDVVISSKVSQDPRPNRVAIYGWHRPDGKPIQQLYTGHINWYVDYSHGIRLIHRKLKVDGKWMDYTQVLQDPELRQLLCDEAMCDFTKYNY
ncbi:hypothetical protein K3G39_01775 [Pontibacter sp. HSC-14F20]|uniref:hypothetical protein n=1 Tax=Pontibacter sp. HSC-14F20 TaxID=2864136 RepID=UPI001C72B29F|nr:hypothetical protein [Pontibacter sp. HSC-14F20]MBX0331960.1 hypothetical protein [Pontibacter sp. HSC-14F20]